MLKRAYLKIKLLRDTLLFKNYPLKKQYYLTEEKEFQKPRLLPEPQPCQHIKILDCDKEVSRVFYECYHCLQGLPEANALLNVTVQVMYLVRNPHQDRNNSPHQ